MSTSKRAAGLGALLSNPTEPADADPDFAAHKTRRTKAAAAKPGRASTAKSAPASEAPAAPEAEVPTWLATDTTSYDEIARVQAPDQAAAIVAVTEETGRRGGFTVALVDPETGGPALVPARTGRATGALAHRGGPAVLPRKRTQRIPKDKLTCQVPVSVLDALDALVERDDSRKYDEVEEALRAHLARKGIEINEG
ncbi:hypothetical protein [Streptomyces longwoodensis]|uniref:hypothetical protein n=1 Tax=Streptomyces longwoodensis TaxID=68231 RepID=UPI0036FEB6A9